MSHNFKPGDVVKRVDNSGFLRVTMPEFIEQRGFVQRVHEDRRHLTVMWLPDGKTQMMHHTGLMRATTRRKRTPPATVPPWARENIA